MIGNITGIIDKILDRLPGRREKILLDIESVKDEIKKLHNKSSKWTDIDSIKHDVLADKLRKLQYRANISK